MNQGVQGKLRAELREAQEQYGREIPYDELSALPYLDAVCRETLRLYVSPRTLHPAIFPPLTAVSAQVCTSRYER